MSRSIVLFALFLILQQCISQSVDPRSQGQTGRPAPVYLLLLGSCPYRLDENSYAYMVPS